MHNSTSRQRWRKLTSINHDFCKKDFTLTLSISGNQLKCCSYLDDIIKVYSLRGELLQTYGEKRWDACPLNRPYVSGYDFDGSVLIAVNDRLQVMSEQGEFSVLQLQPQVLRPRSAVLFNNQLYVTSSPISADHGCICKHSC